MSLFPPRVLSRAHLGLVAAALSLSCGGSVQDSKGEDLQGDGAGGSGSGSSGTGGSSTGGRAGAGGRSSGGADGAGGHSSGGEDGAGGAAASGGAPAIPDGGVPVCPIRKSGTYLTEEDCYSCIPPGAPCAGPCSFPAIQLTAESCVNVLRAQTTLYCVWYADLAEYDQVWGAVSFCESNPGYVACGGGL